MKAAGRGVVIVLAALAAAVVTASCDREDLTVASFPANLTPDAGDDDDAAGAADAASDADAEDSTPCTTDDDCADAEYCNRQGCGQFGSCEPSQSPTCEDGGDVTSAPECGCNDVTYFNSCLRRRDSQSLRKEGPCGQEGTPSCMTQPDCQKLGLTRGDIYCGRLVSGLHTCDDDVSGTCWVLPHSCPTVTDESDEPIWRGCESEGLSCESQCQAIENGGPYSYAEGACQ